ncbi:MAG: hypothetical protein FWB83_08980, partial [Treponema sp.]|nr:hypothetical protein [Treponema sp.]
WGFGLSTAVDAYGILNLSGEMLSFNVVSGEKSDVSGAVFASASINTFFHIERFKLKVSPSIFYAAAYATPGNITYTLANNSNGTSTIVLGYDMYVYTPFSMEKFKDGNFCLTGTPGFDVSVGLEYPLSRAIGITDVLPFLDMDVGLDFINIPIIASTLTDYMLVSGGVEKYDFNIFDEIEDLMKEFGNLDPDTEYGNASQALDRPFKMLAWLNWRPLLGSRLLTINPVVGFSVNHLYSDVFAFEGGINACLNLANLLRVSAGVNYLDRLWVNSIDIALNLRAIELNLGASLRSPDFLASWAAAGLGINLGLKIGW